MLLQIGDQVVEDLERGNVVLEKKKERARLLCVYVLIPLESMGISLI